MIFMTLMIGIFLIIALWITKNTLEDQLIDRFRDELSGDELDELPPLYERLKNNFDKHNL